MPQANYAFSCTCGFKGTASSAEIALETCPVCGEGTAISVMSAVDALPGDPHAVPELVFSQEQLALKWPRWFWRVIGGRLARGEAVVSPKLAGEIIQHLTAPKSKPAKSQRGRAGRKQGSGVSTDELQGQMGESVERLLKKESTSVNVKTVAEECGYSRGTFYYHARKAHTTPNAWLKVWLQALR